LHPVERCGGVGKFSRTVIEAPKAATYAPKIEAQNGEPALGEGVIEVVDDPIVHRAAELRVRMQDKRDRRPSVADWWKRPSSLPAGPVKKTSGMSLPSGLRDSLPRGGSRAARISEMVRPITMADLAGCKSFPARQDSEFVLTGAAR
jgi:hypothetical protein